MYDHLKNNLVLSMIEIKIIKNLIDIRYKDVVVKKKLMNLEISMSSPFYQSQFTTEKREKLKIISKYFPSFISIMITFRCKIFN
jgi:hypothetical protein